VGVEGGEQSESWQGLEYNTPYCSLHVDRCGIKVASKVIFGRCFACFAHLLPNTLIRDLLKEPVIVEHRLVYFYGRIARRNQKGRGRHERSGEVRQVKREGGVGKVYYLICFDGPRIDRF
jgi:hypothetical protein